MKNLHWVLRIIIFVLFVLSGVAKLYPHIWPFEKQLVDLGICNWCLAPYFARAIIGLELAIGVAILFPHCIKRIIIPITILLLVAFCIHLSIQMYIYGPNNGNCGCFGQLIPMTPLEAFIKNIITIGILIYLYKIVPEKPENKFKLIYPLAIFLATELFMFAAFPFAPCDAKKIINSALPTSTNSTNNDIENVVNPISILPQDSILNPVSTSTITSSKPSKKDSIKAAKTATSVTNTDSKNAIATKTTIATVENKGPAKVVSKFAPYSNFNGTLVKVDEGKKIICMFAPGCDHCQATAKEICSMRKAGFPEVAIIFMNEEVDKIPEFLKTAGCNFPYQVVDIPTFWTLLGDGTTPGVIGLWNGNQQKMWEGIDKNKFKASELLEIFK